MRRCIDRNAYTKKTIDNNSEWLDLTWLVVLVAAKSKENKQSETEENGRR